MGFHTGNGGRVTINGTELALTRWSVNPSVEMVQFRNSKTGKFSKKQTTFEDADFSFSIDWEDDNNAFTGPLTLAPGTQITNVHLFLESTPNPAPADGPYWSFPSAFVVRTPQTLDVNGRLETSFECTADGAYGTPGNPL